MKKIINIKEFKYSQESEKDFENFLPIWKKYWETKAPVTMLLGQMITSTRLLQLAIIADKDFKLLDKKCKTKMIKELEATIDMLK